MKKGAASSCKEFVGKKNVESSIGKMRKTFTVAEDMELFSRPNFTILSYIPLY